MAHQTIIIESKAKLSFNDNYMIITKADSCEKVYLEYISCIIINTLEISVTAYLLNEFNKRKVNVIFCDEEHNPSIQMLSLYGSYDASHKLNEQIKWTEDLKNEVWLIILRAKIINQYYVLKKLGIVSIDLKKYTSNLKYMDQTNVEGTVAKIYFRYLFGKDFNRNSDNHINSMLNYGYAILLSFINREVISNGYTTKIGLKHNNKMNWYNLSCDLMEPFRPFVDLIVFKYREKVFNKNIKASLCEFLYIKVKYDGKEYELRNIIEIYIKDI